MRRVGRAAERCLDASSSVGGGRRDPPEPPPPGKPFSVRWQGPDTVCVGRTLTSVRSKKYMETVLMDFLKCHNFFDRLGFSRIRLAYGKHLQCERSSMNYLHDRSHKKAILSLHQVGVQSEKAENEDEKHLNSNNSKHQTQSKWTN